MRITKRQMIAGTAAAVIGVATLGSVGMVSAATTNDGSNGGSSIVDKIASKFNLNKSDVQAVFDQDRTDHKAEMKTKMAENLAQAVTDGKLTQAQADYITSAMNDIDTLMGSSTPGQQDSTVRDQVKTKMDALRQWAKDNNLDMQTIMPMMHGGRGPGGPNGSGMDDGSDMKDTSDGSQSSSSTDSTSSTD